METTAITYRRARGGKKFCNAIAMKSTSFEEERILTAIAEVMEHGGRVTIVTNLGCEMEFQMVDKEDSRQ
jgi:hypothetical protein